MFVGMRCSPDDIPSSKSRMDTSKAMALLGFNSSKTFEATSSGEIQHAFMFRVHNLERMPCDRSDPRGRMRKRDELRNVSEAYQFLTRKNKQLSGRTMAENWKAAGEKGKVVQTVLSLRAAVAAKKPHDLSAAADLLRGGSSCSSGSGSEHSVPPQVGAGWPKKKLEGASGGSTNTKATGSSHRDYLKPVVTASASSPCLPLVASRAAAGASVSSVGAEAASGDKTKREGDPKNQQREISSVKKKRRRQTMSSPSDLSSSSSSTPVPKYLQATTVKRMPSATKRAIPRTPNKRPSSQKKTTAATARRETMNDDSFSSSRSLLHLPKHDPITGMPYSEAEQLSSIRRAFSSLDISQQAVMQNALADSTESVLTT